MSTRYEVFLKVIALIGVYLALSAPDGPHVGPMSLSIGVSTEISVQV